MFTVKGKTVSNGTKTVRFKYGAQKALPFGDRLIVLLDIPEGDPTRNNIYCLTHDLRVAWRSEPLQKKYPGIRVLPYVDILMIDGELIAFDMYCRRFQIDPVTGKVRGYTITK